VALLVAFHREYPLISPLVAVLGDCTFKGAVEPFEPVFEDVVEANQEGEAEVATSQLLNKVVEIEASAPLTLRLNADVTAGIDRKVRVAPSLQAIQLSTVLNRPAFAVCHVFTQGGLRKSRDFRRPSSGHVLAKRVGHRGR
jgi:hypothetical protein